MRTLPSQERIRAALHYDSDTGVFTRLEQRGGSLVGEKAGCFNVGYRFISIDGQQFLAARLAWVYMTGVEPKGEVDHKDTDRANDRWTNLRDVTTKVNAENKRRARVDNKIGLLGVCFDKSRVNKPWVAQIGTRREDGTRHNKRIGRFETPELAHAAYVDAKRALHAGCTI